MSKSLFNVRSRWKSPNFCHHRYKEEMPHKIPKHCWKLRLYEGWNLKDRSNIFSHIAHTHFRPDGDDREAPQTPLMKVWNRSQEFRSISMKGPLLKLNRNWIELAGGGNDQSQQFGQPQLWVEEGDLGLRKKFQIVRKVERKEKNIEEQLLKRWGEQEFTSERISSQIGFYLRRKTQL